MDTALPQKFPFILDRNLAKANCTENLVCTSCDTVVLVFDTNSWWCSMPLRANVWAECTGSICEFILVLPALLRKKRLHVYKINMNVMTRVDTLTCFLVRMRWFSLTSDTIIGILYSVFCAVICIKYQNSRKNNAFYLNPILKEKIVILT